jgi:hypothetical protein
MKTKILILACATIVATMSLRAQTDVQRNSTVSFTSSLSNSPTGGTSVTYTWDATTLGSVASGQGSATAGILFSAAAGTVANVSVFATSASALHCAGAPVSRSFRIVNTLSLNATLPVLSPICPNTTSNPTGGDIPSFTVSFVDAASVATNATGFTYQVLDGAGTIVATASPTFAAATSYSLNIASAYTNAQAGTYTIRITAIANGASNVAFPDASGNYPHTTIAVEVAPDLNTF